MNKNWIVTREQLHYSDTKQTLIVSHRGKFGMTVMENTSLAFLMAINEGADMVEMDISKTADGKLVGFHDNDLQRMAGIQKNIDCMTYDELMNIELFTYCLEKNGAHLETFEEMIAPLKDKTILVLDKCWDYWDDVYRVLVKLGMEKQAVFKFYSKHTHLYETVKNYPGVMFVPMHEANDDMKAILELKKSCDLVGMEILPKDKEDIVFSKEYISNLKKEGLQAWCNSLSYCSRLIFGAGYDDLKSLTQGGDYGWGVLISQGVSVIQTDWPYELTQYLESKNEEWRKRL